MSRHRLTALLVVGAIVAIPQALAAPAHASHGGTASTGVLNTANWGVCVSANADGTTAFQHALDEVNATEVNATFVDCHSGLSNVVAYYQSYPDSWYGLTSCLTGVSNGRCGSKSVAVNSRTSTTVQQRLMTAAHEFGHVGGLGHRFTNDSCMTQGASPPIAMTFDAHDITALNQTY